MSAPLHFTPDEAIRSDSPDSQSAVNSRSCNSSPSSKLSSKNRSIKQEKTGSINNHGKDVDHNVQQTKSGKMSSEKVSTEFTTQK